ncbi:hypothetical protein B0T12DRAFT_400939 [Alternaria alternata]|nr:hypothetical protein B0T12DRAFT_400939 [Alternaria alternata]
MFSSKRPSQMLDGPNQTTNDRLRHYRKSLVERFITEAVESKSQFGPGNFLYVCLAALLELHLSTAPMDVFYSGLIGGHMGSTHKYRSFQGATNESLSVRNFPDMGWSRLRMELDHQRHTLRWMTRFFKRHFDYRNKDLQAAFKEVRERFKLQVQDLEQVESQLRDQIASEGVHKSISMAEISIRESKRVMILTALAFIFLPISLASSVYGMVRPLCYLLACILISHTFRTYSR